VESLLGSPYTSSQMSYDLARLRKKGLLQREPGRNRYHLTADGQRVVIFYTRIYNRLLRPMPAADQTPAPPDLRRALATIERHVGEGTERAHLRNAA
jgi:predicted MarR family transcription regulator